MDSSLDVVRDQSQNIPIIHESIIDMQQSNTGKWANTRRRANAGLMLAQRM